ncbi:hypothetical protein D3C76_1345600 [compost metagenome]
MTGHADHIAFLDVVVLAELQAVGGDQQHLLLAVLVDQGDLCVLAALGDLLDAGNVLRPLRFLGLVGEVLRHTVPAPFVGNQRGGVPDAQADQQDDQPGQPMPGPGCAFRLSHESLP